MHELTVIDRSQAAYVGCVKAKKTHANYESMSFYESKFTALFFAVIV